jgi:hypothetical protein
MKIDFAKTAGGAALVLATMLSAPVAHAQDAVARVDAANARCEAARAARLAPLRARKIAVCKRSARPPTAGCETFYSTWGDNSNHANGSVVRGLFYDLPACVDARRISDRALHRQDS